MLNWRHVFQSYAKGLKQRASLRPYLGITLHRLLLLRQSLVQSVHPGIKFLENDVRRGLGMVKSCDQVLPALGEWSALTLNGTWE